MNQRKLLEEAGTAVVHHSKNTAAPVLRVQIEESKEGVVVRVVFQEVEQLMAMEEQNLKDQLMKWFLTSLSENGYDFYSQPNFQFAFDVTI